MTAARVKFQVASVNALFLLLSLVAFAQSPSRMVFEVASVRIASPSTRSSQRITDTRVDLINTPLRSVLLTAFSIAPFELVAPAWVDQVRIDIQATIPTGLVRRSVPEMLRTLLRERFGLTTHAEPRPLEVNELRVARGGHKMTEVQPLDELSAELQNTNSSKSPTTFVSETVDGPTSSAMIPLGMRKMTTRTRYDQIFTERGTTVLRASRMSITELVSILRSTLDEPVINKTGLAGVYQFEIELPPDATITKMMLAAGTTTTVKGTPLTEPTGVSIPKALKGIGLEIERRRAPVEVIVVDTMSRSPTPN